MNVVSALKKKKKKMKLKQRGPSFCFVFFCVLVSFCYDFEMMK